jgi:hypothetical protein
LVSKEEKQFMQKITSITPSPLAPACATYLRPPKRGLRVGGSRFGEGRGGGGDQVKDFHGMRVTWGHDPLWGKYFIEVGMINL